MKYKADKKFTWITSYEDYSKNPNIKDKVSYKEYIFILTKITEVMLEYLIQGVKIDLKGFGVIHIGKHKKNPVTDVMIKPRYNNENYKEIKFMNRHTNMYVPYLKWRGKKPTRHYFWKLRYAKKLSLAISKVFLENSFNLYKFEDV